MGTAKNYDILRYDDLLLMQAEAYIEIGQQDKALPIINQLRRRAAGSTGKLKNIDGSFPSKYNIKEYTGAAWTQDYARKALQWERRLEFATEGARFFDLVRWGIADVTLNAFLAYEKTKLSAGYGSATFVKGKNEYFPIPQRQIDLEISGGKSALIQNPGY